MVEEISNPLKTEVAPRCSGMPPPMTGETLPSRVDDWEAEAELLNVPAVERTAELERIRSRRGLSLLVAVMAVAISPLVQPWWGPAGLARATGQAILTVALGSFLLFYCGLPILRACLAEQRQRRLGLMTLGLIALAAGYAYVLASLFGAPQMFLLVPMAILIAALLHAYTTGWRTLSDASAWLERLSLLRPAAVHQRMPDGSIEESAIEDVGAFDQIVVKRGETVPLDGVIESGISWVDESMFSAESIPVPKGKGDTVSCGTINGDGQLVVEATSSAEESRLGQAVTFIREAMIVALENQRRDNQFARIAALAGLATTAMVGGTALLAVNDLTLVSQIVVGTVIALALAVTLRVALRCHRERRAARFGMTFFLNRVTSACGNGDCLNEL